MLGDMVFSASISLFHFARLVRNAFFNILPGNGKHRSEAIHFHTGFVWLVRDFQGIDTFHQTLNGTVPTDP